MNSRELVKTAGRGVAIGAAMAAAGYAALVVLNRARYGDRKSFPDAQKDSSLDRFIPEPEVVEHHQIAIAAPADVVIASAKQLELLKSPVIRAIFRARELALGGEPDTRPHPSTLMEQMQSIGWVVLAERPGREIVLGSVTQPWQAAPLFRSVPGAEFRGFSEPGYVKIAWTLRADPVTPVESIFRSETRAVATDAAARARFRRYWSLLSPGIIVIRWLMLGPVKAAAEGR